MLKNAFVSVFVLIVNVAGAACLALLVYLLLVDESPRPVIDVLGRRLTEQLQLIETGEFP